MKSEYVTGVKYWQIEDSGCGLFQGACRNMPGETEVIQPFQSYNPRPLAISRTAISRKRRSVRW